MSTLRSKQHVPARMLAVLVTALLATSLAAAQAPTQAPAQVPAQEQEQAAAITLPAAEQLLDAYVEAIGGTNAFAKIESLASTGSMTIEPLGLKGSLSIYQARPDRSSMTFVCPAIGTVRSGAGNGIAWEMTDIMGPRLLKGEEQRFALQTSAIDGLVAWRDQFASVETVGSEEVDGSPCWRLLMTTSSGEEQTWYLDKESHLLRKLELELASALGTIQATLVLDDYRDVGGVLIPHHSTSAAMGQAMVATVDSVEVNTSIDEAFLAPPPEITELLKAGS